MTRVVVVDDESTAPMRRNERVPEAVV